MVHRTIGGTEGLEGIGATRHLDRAPRELVVKRHGIAPQLEAVRHVDIRCGELRRRLCLAPTLHEGIAVDVVRYISQCAGVSELERLSLILRALAEGEVPDTEEVLVHHQRGVVLVRLAVAILPLDVGEVRELVVDEHPVLIVVLQLETVDDLVRGDDIEVITLRRHGHLPVVILGDIDLLDDGDDGLFACYMIGIVDVDHLVGIRTDTDLARLIAHTQDSMHSIDLVVALDIALDLGGRSLDDLLEEGIYTLIGAAPEEASYTESGEEVVRYDGFHSRSH